MVKSLMGRKLKQDDDGTDQIVNQSRTTGKDSERDVYQVRIQEKVETIWLFDRGNDAHVMPKHVLGQLGEPSLQTTRVTLRGASGLDLGAMGVVQIRGFIGKIEVQFTTVVARDARRCLPSGTKLRTQGHTFTSSQHETFLTQPKWQQQQKVTMSREGNTDTLKVACMWKPRDAQSVTSLMLKRDLENVRRELRNLKTGQHENKRENTTREMTLGEKIAHERTGHAKDDPRCETCLTVRRVSTHSRKAVAEAAHSDYATVKNNNQSAEVKILVGAGPRR